MAINTQFWQGKLVRINGSFPDGSPLRILIILRLFAGPHQNLPAHIRTHSHHVGFAPSLADLQTVRVTNIEAFQLNTYASLRALVPLNYGHALWSVLLLSVDVLSDF